MIRLPRVGVLVLAVLVTGCASTVPEPIRAPLADSPTLPQVREDPGTFVGERVRWGGTIVAVENREQYTRLEVVARKLTTQGRPEEEDATPGRFLAILDGFRDPAVYGQGRAITVVGELEASQTHTIGEFPYRFPVVRVRSHHLWAKVETVRESLPPPWYYDPWYYDPWYPYYRPYHPYW